MLFKCKNTGEEVEVIRRKEWPEPDDFRALAEMCGDQFAFGPDGMFIVDWGEDSMGETTKISSTEIKPEDRVIRYLSGKIEVLSPADFAFQFEGIQ